MSTAAIVLAVAGPVAVAAAWIAIRREQATVWTLMAPVLAISGFAALLTDEARPAGENTGLWTLAGLVTGLVLYLATRAFMVVARRWRRLSKDTESLYGEGDSISMGWALVLGVLVSAPAEELLWRGVVLAVMTDAVTSWNGSWAPLIAGTLTWILSVGVNAFSGSLPILLGAVVSGGVWTALAVSSEGVAAPIASHVVWTALMIVLPPGQKSG